LHADDIPASMGFTSRLVAGRFAGPVRCFPAHPLGKTHDQSHSW